MKIAKMFVMLFCFVLGVGAAMFLPSLLGKEEIKDVDDPDAYYRCLAPGYNKEAFITLGAYSALELTARRNHENYLTEKLIKTGAAFSLQRDKLQVIVGTKCQPSWNKHKGGGEWSVSDRELRQAYKEAAKTILKEIRRYFPLPESGLMDDEIEIVFFIRGFEVGTWSGGKFKLAGEK